MKLRRSRRETAALGILGWLLIIAILALLVFFILQTCKKGKGPATPVPSSVGVPGLAGANLTAADEAVRATGKNFVIYTAPVADCSKAGDLTADVKAAQAKIDAAARDYPNDYKAHKSSLQSDVDMLNQSIREYNRDCNSNIPEVTLPP